MLKCISKNTQAKPELDQVMISSHKACNFVNKPYCLDKLINKPLLFNVLNRYCKMSLANY